MNDYTVKSVCLADSDSQGRVVLQVGTSQVTALRPLFDKEGGLYGVLYTVAGDSHRMVPAAAIRDMVLEPKTASRSTGRRG